MYVVKLLLLWLCLVVGDLGALWDPFTAALSSAAEMYLSCTISCTAWCLHWTNVTASICDCSELSQHAFSRAYINLTNRQDIPIFIEKFDGYVFVDSRGNNSGHISMCTVNFHCHYFVTVLTLLVGWQEGQYNNNNII